MSVIVGIDIGGSATKIVGFEETDNKMLKPILIRASDPLASLYGAFGKFTTENNLTLPDIKKIMVTGIGSSFVNDLIFGIPTGKVDEFICIGLGGQYLTGIKRAVVVSMGTGTAFVAAIDEQMTHLGGSGVGGGTILGLAHRLMGIRLMENITELASEGDLSKVNLTIGDILSPGDHHLPDYATASNFGKLSDLATYSDIALGLINMVFENIGVMSSFAASNLKVKDVVLTGKLSTVEHGKATINALSDLFQLNYIIPNNSEFATACGAALTYIKGINYTPIMRE